MTSIAFIAGFLAFLIGACAFLPVGILAWTWLTLQNPHQVIGVDLPLNLAIVIACVIGLITNRKRATVWADGTVILMMLLLLHSGLTTMLALSPDYSYPYFDRMWKTMALAGFIVLFMQNRTRLQALVWVIVASIGMLALKGSAFSILTAGQFRVWGPIGSQIHDNNHFAGAICMTIPLCFYLVATTKNAMVKLALRCLGWSLPLAALFTYSRGGLLTLLAVAGCYFLQTKRKLPMVIAAVAVFLVLLPMMPSHWLDRMNSISETIGDSSKADESVQGRFNAWYVYSRVAMDRPLIGGGFRAPELQGVWNTYLNTDNAKAAHNNIFQVLGEHGFLGLGLYFLIILLAFKNVAAIIVRTRHIPELGWSRSLAIACGISLFAYMVAGLTVSIPYYDLFIVLVVFIASLRRLVVQQISSRERARNPADARSPYGATPFPPPTGHAVPSIQRGAAR
ncbi:MAG: putative O-glycosylation ligase, exosortase A system-associated [Rhodospirillales bacterium]|nr:putative O-glycosylation ligase, exosortase A system-associated [Rhodospirillales bacterium]